MRAAAIAIALLALVEPAAGQLLYNPPDLAVYARLTDVPQPAASVPPSDTLMGGSGAAVTYQRSDAARPTVVQAANVLTDAGGNWAVTFAKQFTSSSPIVTAKAVVASGNLPVDCETATRSSSGASGWCRQASTALISLGLLPLTINVFSTQPNTNTPVMIIAREPTQ